MSGTKGMNLSQANKELSGRLIKIKCKDGEYRVSFMFGVPEFQERTAYYTDDLCDALATGHAMAKAEGL